MSRNFFLLNHFLQPLELFGQGGVSKERFCFYMVVASVILGPARAKIRVYPNSDHPIQSLNPLPIHIGLSSALEMSQNWGEWDVNVHSKV